LAVLLTVTLAIAGLLWAQNQASAAHHHPKRHLMLLFDREFTSPDYEVFSMKPDGGGEKNLTKNSIDDWGPQASTDGKRIVFTSERDKQGNDEIFVMNANGSHVKQLTHTQDPVYNEWPHFSPDGKKIVFDSDRRDGNTDELWVMNSDGSHQHALHRDGYDATYSPNGKKIAYSSNAGTSTQVGLIDANGSHFFALTANPATNEEPSWFPSGKKVAFDSNVDGDTEIWTVNIKTRDDQQLTHNADGDESPAVDPSGKRIALSS
jgi:TolB protein